jgi:hypothetical protein
VTSRLRGLMSGCPEAAAWLVDVGRAGSVGRWVMTGFYDAVHGLEP